MRPFPALLATVLATLMAAPAEGARLEPITRKAFAPTSDPTGLVLWSPGARDRDRVHVFDLRTGARRTLAKDPRCGPATYPTGGERALLSCRREGGYDGDLLDLRTGAVTPLPRTLDIGAGPQRISYWQALGRHWALGTTPEGRRVAYAWRTGEVRDTGTTYDRSPELDDPQLGPPQSPCPRYNRIGSYAAPYFLSPEYEAPLVLHHCDGGRRVLFRRRTDASVIAGRRVVWSARGRVHAYGIRSRRRREWRLPGFRKDVDEPVRTLTAGRDVILAVTRTEACDKTCVQKTAALYLLPR